MTDEPETSDALAAGLDGRPRCFWAVGGAPGYVAYHDAEWGRPVLTDDGLFERLTLEAFQSRLSWLTILRKRESFGAAFAVFVVRVAGNVIDPVTLGSIEYAAKHVHAPLVVIMGHSECGAVGAAVQGGEAPGDIAAIVRRIKPAVALAKAGGATGADLAAKSVLVNVELQTKAAEHSKVLEELVHEGKLRIVDAVYDIKSGEITWP